MTQNDTNPEPITVGQDVSWWTGRGSSGRGIVTKIECGRVFVEPAADSIKGSDYRVLRPSGRIAWTMLTQGIPIEQINTPPDPWYENS
jgi:hypothetical protein